MSDFEKKVRANVVTMRNQAVTKILVKMIYASLAMLAFCWLYKISFISWEFMWILFAGAALTCAFVAGRISRDIKF